MKTKIIISIICTCSLFYVQAQNYQELLKEGNKWNVLQELLTTCCSGFATTFSFTLSGDTLIENVSYKKLMCEIFEANWRNEIVSRIVYAVALRENVENQKVYVKYPNDEEQILYSFNLQIGDTISIHEHTDWLFGTERIVKYVKNIEDYNFNEYIGKKISVSDTTYNITRGFKYETFTDVWYEGIGSLKTLIPFYYNGSDTFEYEYSAQNNGMELLCFWNYDDLIYRHEYREECVSAYTVGLEDISNNRKIVIYQNFDKGELIIDSDLDISIIQVYNLMGNKIAETTQKNVNITNFSNGIYLIKVHLSDNTIYTEKWIKY